MRKWLKRHKALFIGLVIIVSQIVFIRSCGIWFLSTASPTIFKSVYQQTNEPQENNESGQITYLRDTLYVDGHKIISHKSVEHCSINNGIAPKDANSWKNGEITLEELGVLGDSAGLWNALFSGLAVTE